MSQRFLVSSWPQLLLGLVKISIIASSGLFVSFIFFLISDCGFNEGFQAYSERNHAAKPGLRNLRGSRNRSQVWGYLLWPQMVTMLVDQLLSSLLSMQSACFHLQPREMLQGHTEETRSVSALVMRGCCP
jgi:hypothetical protein